MASLEIEADFVVIGGGLSGCVLASRLSQRHSVILIEAGDLPDNHPLIGPPLACFAAARTELDWNYTTVPQTNLNGKECYASGGKVLSGGTAINRGAWSIGSYSDWDEFARLVADASFRSSEMQPFYARVPIHAEKVSVTRQYPLRARTKAMLEEGGIPFNSSGGSGDILGFEECQENWKDSRRQLASKAYDLSRVHIMHKTTVARLLYDEQDRRVVGVLIDADKQIRAKKEVILSAGAYRTPQVLLLSGIGPREELERHGIEMRHESPDVGRGFFDHFCAFMWWKLRRPEDGLAAGSTYFNDNKTLMSGMPGDWVMWQRCPDPLLRKALECDQYDCDQDPGAVLHPARAHSETLFYYIPPGGLPANVKLPVDGTLIGQNIFVAAPTSRGAIRLRSRDPLDNPEVDPNYFASEADRIVLRSALRQVHKLYTQTKHGKEMVSEEWLPAELKHCTTTSDEHLDARIRRLGGTLYHPGGSASMGKVVEADFRLKGMGGLRIVDASVAPLPMAGHSQTWLYAMAEKAAEVILACH